jgi:hypothetical protein
MEDECGVCNGDGSTCGGDDICNDDNACNQGEEGDCEFYVDCSAECGGTNWDCYGNDESVVGSWEYESGLEFENDDCTGNSTPQDDDSPTDIILNADGTGSIYGPISFGEDGEFVSCEEDIECASLFDQYICPDSYGNYYSS